MASGGTSNAARHGQALAHHRLPCLLAAEVEGPARPASRAKGDARSDSQADWHQDEAYWAPDLEYNSISIWVPLQEVTLENGCMHFIPGSHKLEVAAHRPIGQDSSIHGLEAEQVDASHAVACPVAAGGATIHHCRTFHYAGPNHTKNPRLAYINGFATPPKQRAISRDFYWKDSRQTLRDERRRAAGTKPTSGGRQIGS